ncbi:uncharacterized protein LOC111326872 [Stylophora pistillata]|uniref:uncharacterized protein LOC111326872 n=1 Tax=Stylophora pistillata TaxID=50429 RepID=UPI000C03A688|nr:uncharacterized protein LOC111326872 [Stylophora pistillata]
MFFLGILDVFFKPCAKLSSSRGTFFIFFVGTPVVIVVNIFQSETNLENDQRIRQYYRLSTVPLVGIIFTFIGAKCFFRVPEEANRETLGQQQPSMGMVVSLLTFSLIVLEILLMCALSSGTYIYLWNTVIRHGRKESVKFYFRLLSLFNFIERVNVENDIQLSGINKEVLKSWFVVLTSFYEALIIDYRLMCSLLFLEHSIEVQHQENENTSVSVQHHEDLGSGGEVQNQNDIHQIMMPRNEIWRGFGYVVGCLCLIAPVLCGLQFAPIFHFGSCVNILAIIVNLFIVVCGTCLLHDKDLDDDRHAKTQGVKVTVYCLGAVGFTCWIVQAAIFSFWASLASVSELPSRTYISLLLGCSRVYVLDRASRYLFLWASLASVSELPSRTYIIWIAVKFFIRSFTTAFLIGFFRRIDAEGFLNQADDKDLFLVPAVILAVFSTSAIKNETLTILFEADPPMYLGFLIHVFLCFVIIQTRLRNCAARPESQAEPIRNTDHHSRGA